MLAAEGAQVGVLDLNRAALEEAATILKTAAAAIGEVGREDEAAAAVAEIAAKLGGLDGVVNSAGIDLIRPFSEMDVLDWNRIMSVNLNGPFNVCKAALPHLKRAEGGTIVNVASAAGLRPLEHRTAYCASKAGLVMFTKTLAADLAAEGIRANVVCPGIVETPLFTASYANAPDPEAELARIKDRYCIKRAARPDEIASAIVFLTSRESSYVTGAALAVDGGRTFH
jgi:NAD(P)-dependent dehydrogenase (short-subunit alcohol dehydrogenase family)